MANRPAQSLVSIPVTKQQPYFMKKTLYLLLLSGSTALAQTTIPNSNFSQWATATNGTDSLVNWSSSNAVVMFPVRSLVKDSLFSGHYTAHVITAPFGFAQWTAIGMLVNGSATFSYDGGGGTVTGGVRYVSGGGTPLSFKPTHLTGNYRYETLTAGSGFATVYTTRFNTVMHQRDTVGIGTYAFTSQAGYVPFSIPISDLKPGITPDTITTIFYSYNPASVPPMGGWADLYLDDLRLLPVSSRVPEPHKAGRMMVFPNPTSGKLTAWWTAPPPTGTALEVINAAGQRVTSVAIPAGQQKTELDLTNLPAGLYLLRVGEGVAERIIIGR